MKRREMVAAAASAVVASVLVASVAWAAIPGDGGVIQGCYTKVGGVLRVIDTARGQACHPSFETPISWSQAGPQGPPGADGADGADGASPTVAQLSPGDPDCPTGGAAITDAAGSRAYVCSGADGTDGEPFAGTFTSPNGEYSITVTDAGVTIAHGTAASIRIVDGDVLVRGDNASVIAESGFEARGGTDVTIRSDSTATIQSSAAISVLGSLVRLNATSSCPPAARAGDVVLVDPATGSGSVVSGSTTVCIG